MEIPRKLEEVMRRIIEKTIEEMVEGKEFRGHGFFLSVLEKASKEYPLRNIEVWGNGVAFNVDNYNVYVSYGGLDEQWRKLELSYEICIKDVCKRFVKPLKWWVSKIAEKWGWGTEEDIEEATRKIARDLVPWLTD